ncbi:MAG TPA: FtsK/SpoIIIE domain-containing protein [Pedococcus sp.]
MRLRLTVAVPAPTGDRPPAANAPVLHEVEVEATPGATVHELVDALAEHLGVPGTGLRSRQTAVRPDALVGLAPLVDGAALTLLDRQPGAEPELATTRDGTPLALAVTHGPDAGRRVTLPPGRLTLGRSGSAGLQLEDARLSRLHAAVETGPDGIRVADLGSTNGIRMGEQMVGAKPVLLPSGAVVALGDTRIEVRATGAVPAASTARPDGTRAVNRRPRAITAAAPPAIALPAPPEPPHRARIPWVAMAVPIPVAGALAMFLGPTMLAFALMSPLLLAGAAIGDRLGSRREYAARLAEYARSHGAALARVEAACAAERRSRLHAQPDPAELLSIATGPTARLWERRRTDDDALVVSLGTCTAPAAVRVIRPRDDDGPEHPPLGDVPCTLPLAEVGVLGVCGDRPQAAGAARNLLGQLAVLHSPLDLEIVAVVATAEAASEWEWLGRLPHTRRPDGSPRPGSSAVHELDPDGVGEAVERLATRARERLSRRTTSVAWAGPRTVLLLDGSAALRGVPGVAEVLTCGPEVGIVVVALDATDAQLPTEARAVLDLGLTQQPILSGALSEVEDLLVDRVGPWWADRVSRGLASLRDATPATGPRELPTSASLRDVSGFDVTDPAEVAAAWDARPWATAVPVGVGGEGPYLLDLAADGPHVLVGGTTGSGKSELLRTLVVSLATHNRPEQLSLVLIDYKGGAAFRECAALPHTAGVVTDLDDRLADRALRSLRAELRRRERFLGGAGAADHAGYLATPAARTTPLPRLVVVIDEFRALAEELPAFVDGMVRLAALGRSLGVHLVMATQRPAGVVTADIKANLNLRIALRVRDRADSDDVIDCAEAAALDPRIPGRALARSGDGSLVGFQSVHLSAPWRHADPSVVRVRAVRWGTAAGPWLPALPTVGGTSELRAVVDAVTQATATVGARPAPAAWLPTLPIVLEGPAASPELPPHRVRLGLVDRPDRQAQEPLVLDLHEPGLWGFAGTSGSGRTTALLSVATNLATQLEPSDLHLYAVSGGSLARLAELPHCGAHVEQDDLNRLERLVSRLALEVADRRRALAGSGRGTFARWREATATAPPHVLVLVDDWDLLAQRTDGVEHAGLAERLLALLREGEAVGVRAVLAGDRALLVGRVASAVEHRVLLRLADRADAALAGLATTSALPADPPPGRGVLADGAEIQLSLPTGEAPRKASREGAGPLRVEALPTHVSAVRLASSTLDGDEVALGLGGDELTVQALTPGRDGRRWLVAGPAGSGVTTTLAVAAVQLLRQGRPLAVVASRPGALDALRGDPHLAQWCDPVRPQELVQLREQRPDLVVVADDVDQLLDTPVEPVLREVARLADRDGGLLLCGASSTSLATQYRGIALEVARDRTGVLLGPGTIGDADLFGLRLRPDRTAPPGRGHLVVRGRAVPMQVALPDPPSRGGASSPTAASSAA